MTQILFEGFTFDDEATTGFTITRWSGWWDGPPVRRRGNERPQADGDFGSSKNWRGARVVTVEGSYVGTTMQDTYAAMQSLAALQASGVASDFRVVEPFSTLTAVVELAGAPRMPDHLAFPFFSFAFDVVAPDPYRYGDMVSVFTGVPVSGGGLLFPLGTTPSAFWDFGADGSSGRVSVTNLGSAAVWPILSVAGGMSGGFVATDVTSGGSVRFERSIPEGSVVSINQRTGRASIDGQSDVSGFITGRDFFSVPAGGTHQIQFAVLGSVSGSPQFTVLFAPAFH